MQTIKAEETINRQRRSVLIRLFQWSGATISLFLIYPLLRFLSFTVQPKPRYVMVAAPLPLSGYHAEREFVLFAGEEKPFAVSRTCTHLGCRINFLEDKHIFECPCHQSQFTLHGERIAGPAKNNLTTFKVETKKAADGTVSGYIVTL